MQRKSSAFTVLLYSMLFVFQPVSSQGAFTLTGSTFDERCESLINCMVNDIDPYAGNVNIKYTSPYYWARIYKNVDTERAIAQLETLYAAILVNPSAVTGSDIEFFAHMTIHGYFLCKDKLSGNLIRQIKQFLMSIDFNKIGSTSTLNLDMMRYTAGFLAAQEWSDFTDLNRKTAEQVTAYNRARILTTLDNIFHDNCKEMDAFIYLPTNTMYIRMLAEYTEDEEVKQRAYVVYQQMLASMIGAWNKGLYVANPPRAKGWSHLVTGPYAANARATAFAWLYFGNPTNSMVMDNQYLSDNNNYADFCFWVAYKGKIRPMQEIIDAEKRKIFPYEYRSYLDDKSVTAANGIKLNWKYYRYNYQSENFGLSTQTEIPYALSDALKLYTYKETKRTYLAWHSDVPTSQCFFTVCQDNPMRPTDAVTANAVGYGENPFHRALQHKDVAIGITNVSESYIDGKRYQLYVPFTRIGIKERKDLEDWVLCHTGSMMFAFKTIEPFTVLTGRMPYTVPNCDVLMFTDMYTRKGSWILQATEITDDLKGTNMSEELEKFHAKLIANTKIETFNYESDTPQLKFTTLNGDVLDLTFFPPTEAYNGQYKINGTVQVLDDENLYNSPYTKQADKSDDVYIYDTIGNPTILNWNDPVPPVLGIQTPPADKGTIECVQDGNVLNIRNIPAEGKSSVTFYNEIGEMVKQAGIVVNNHQCAVDIDSLSNTLYIVQISVDHTNWSAKWIKTTKPTN